MPLEGWRFLSDQINRGFSDRGEKALRLANIDAAEKKWQAGAPLREAHMMQAQQEVDRMKRDQEQVPFTLSYGFGDELGATHIANGPIPQYMGEILNIISGKNGILNGQTLQYEDEAGQPIQFTRRQMREQILPAYAGIIAFNTDTEKKLKDDIIRAETLLQGMEPNDPRTTQLQEKISNAKAGLADPIVARQNTINNLNRIMAAATAKYGIRADGPMAKIMQQGIAREQAALDRLQGMADKKELIDYGRKGKGGVTRTQWLNAVKEAGKEFEFELSEGRLPPNTDRAKYVNTRARQMLEMEQKKPSTATILNAFDQDIENMIKAKPDGYSDADISQWQLMAYAQLIPILGRKRAAKEVEKAATRLKGTEAKDVKTPKKSAKSEQYPNPSWSSILGPARKKQLERARKMPIDNTL